MEEGRSGSGCINIATLFNCVPVLVTGIFVWVPHPVDHIQQLPLDKLQQLQAFIYKLEKGV